MIRIFGYLAWRSAWNRVARQLRQLRSPRYFLACLVGGAYLWMMLATQRPAPAGSAAVSRDVVELVTALLLAGTVAWAWIFGVERRVLAFSPAEVTFLFSGPVSRRGLIQYKLLRTQLLILFNTLLWTLILSYERLGVSPWLRALSIWVLLTTLSFHRLGASFVRTSVAEHGRFGARHRIVSLVVLTAVVTALVFSIADALPVLQTAWGRDIGAFLGALGDAASRPLPNALLYPFRILVRPLAADGFESWLRAIGPALVLLVLHYVWVIRSDAAFEEAAAEASLRRARELAERRSGRTSGPWTQAERRAAGTSETWATRRLARLPFRLGLPGATRRLIRPPFRLAPTGWPGGAIFWKNLVAAVRTRRVRNAAVALAAAGVLVAVLSFDPEGALAETAGWLAVTWTGAMVVIGPQWVRNDLRGDLLKLDLLRSYPLRGRTVVIAEVAASTVALTAIQWSLLLLAYLAFLGNDTLELGLVDRTAILVAAVVYLPGINLMGMLIQNAVALLYPSWVHLGSGRPGGVEALGQNMLMMIAFVVLLALTLVLPAALGWSGFYLFWDAAGLWAALPATVVTLGALALEATLIIRWLGRVFERTDPAGAGIPV